MLSRPRLHEEFAYHPPVLKKVSSPAEKFLQAVLVAIVGTGFGIGVGVFLAGRTLPSEASAAISPAPATGTAGTATVASAQPAAKNAPTIVAASSNIPAPKPTPVAKPGAQSQTAVADHAIQPRIISATLTGRRARLHHRHGLRHRGVFASIGYLKPKAQPLVELATLEIPDGRFRFTVEGDQTAVAYDAQSGIVSTEGSGVFVVEKADRDVKVLHPQVTPSNVHYRCDQDANCSLIMASGIIPHARMRSVSHTTDWAYIPVTAESQNHDGTQAPVYFGHVSR